MTDNSESIIYAGSFDRSLAALIDFIIVGFLRMAIAQIIGTFWLNDKIIGFLSEFQNKFGENISKANPEHIAFIQEHLIFKITILFFILMVLIGTFYHALFNSSSWCATIGKRMMGIALIKNEGKALNFSQALWHYFMSLVPWVFMTYILFYQLSFQTTLYQTFANNQVNLILGFIIVFWIQIQMITKKKTTAHDLICHTTMIEGKFGDKFPQFIR